MSCQRWPKDHLKGMSDAEIRQAGFSTGQCPRCKLPMDMSKSGWGNLSNICNGPPCEKWAYFILLEGNTKDQETRADIKRELVSQCVFKGFY